MCVETRRGLGNAYGFVLRVVLRRHSLYGEDGEEPHGYHQPPDKPQRTGDLLQRATRHD